jgi:hypothetical protein
MMAIAVCEPLSILFHATLTNIIDSGYNAAHLLGFTRKSLFCNSPVARGARSQRRSLDVTRDMALLSVPGRCRRFPITMSSSTVERSRQQ